MAVDRRQEALERELAVMLMTANVHRAAKAGCRKRGDAAGVARCEQQLKIDDVRVRKYCLKHGMDLPSYVASMGAE